MNDALKRGKQVLRCLTKRKPPLGSSPQSARGLAHSKTLRAIRKSTDNAAAFWTTAAAFAKDHSFHLSDKDSPRIAGFRWPYCLMGKKQGVLLLIILAGAFGVTAWLLLPPREPAYQGKPLSAWLKDLEENWVGDKNDAACLAFRAMGTNAIPALLSVIQSEASPMQKLIWAINRKQTVIQLPSRMAGNRHVAAAWALYAMGTNAKPAMPVLTNLLFHSNALITSTIALAGIGPEALPALLAALTNQNYRIRDSAASGLGWECSDFNVVVPALIASLQDRESLVQWAAVSSLGQLHAMPELAVPALMNDFSNTDVLLRRSILISLGQFETRAKASVPILLAALKDNDEDVRSSAAFALKQIDPSSVTNLNANAPR
jgi:hypothetical protein